MGCVELNFDEIATRALSVEASAGQCVAAPMSPAFGPATLVIGELLALTDGGFTPLVRFEGQPGSAALPALSTVDLQGVHIGARVALMFEAGDPARPIVIGVLRSRAGRMLAAAAPVVLEVDGGRLLVCAKDRLVLSCGEASITLTSAGKVLIRGTYVQSESDGVNRIQGGSVQIN